MNRIFFFAALFFLMAACESSSSTPPSVSLEAEVMGVHDEVMPKMGYMAVLRDSLNNVASSLQADSTFSDSTLLFSLQEASGNLTTADEAMMNWMRNYDKPGEEMAEEQKTAYLEAEKVKVNEVKDKMLSSIAAAEALLQQVQGK